MRFKTMVAVTEKGAVKAEARKQLMAKVFADPEKMFAKAQRVEGKNTFTIPVEDAEGNVVYVTYDVTVSAKNPADRAEKTRKPKAAANADVEVE